MFEGDSFRHHTAYNLDKKGGIAYYRHHKDDYLLFYSIDAIIGIMETKILIKSTADIGKMIAELRTASGETQSSFAANVGVGERFLRHLEHGSATASIGAVLSILENLGVEISASIPNNPIRERPRRAGRPIGSIKSYA